MIKIDWRMAPEWADGHGLISWQGFTEVWINADQYAVVGREGGPYPWGGGTGDTRHNHTRGQVEYITPRPDRWGGEGLPPVDLAVEWYSDSNTGWQEITVLAYHGDDAWIQPKGKESMIVGNIANFRPIRTPEQIEAQEREQAIQDLYFTVNWSEGRETWPFISKERKADYAKAIDAGYRKQEAS